MLENWRAFHPCETTEIRRGTALVLHCTSYEYDGRNALEKLAVRFTDSFEGTFKLRSKRGENHYANRRVPSPTFRCPIRSEPSVHF